MVDLGFYFLNDPVSQVFTDYVYGSSLLDFYDIHCLVLDNCGFYITEIPSVENKVYYRICPEDLVFYFSAQSRGLDIGTKDNDQVF